MKMVAALMAAALVSLGSAGVSAAASSCEDGCWVQVWEDKNFHGDNDKICGPGKWEKMRKLPNANKKDWGDKIDSVKVGPAAEVTFWEDKKFKGDSMSLKPEEQRPNLMGEPDMGEAIDSMEISCR